MRLKHLRGGAIVQAQWVDVLEVGDDEARRLLRTGAWVFDGAPPGEHVFTMTNGSATATVPAGQAHRFPGWQIVAREFRADPAWAEFTKAGRD